MHKLFKSFGISLASLGIIAIANAAEPTGRAAYNVSNVNMNNRAGVVSSSQRMPTMPTLPINTVGNVSNNVPSGNNDGGGTVTPPPPGPDPKPDCPDGGVRNSTYTVENCMNDVLACVNNGALPGGLNDLFNEDLRNAIFNGMSLCYVQVEKCVTEVRKDCKNVYRSSSDVWLDFNSRKVQPEYYSFILRKTGLTPNQAENTCLLLDRNTYGSSFAGVGINNQVTTEYNNNVNAYNNQGGNLSKDNPQGVKVNTDGKVDANRGHYARWDAATGECLIRVAAYNKDSQIKNSWLFGGDDRLAEVWQPAGSSFTCNKDLFEFALKNATKTVAVLGLGGGTLVGTGVGAIAGHGKRDFDCDDKGHLKELTSQLRSSGYSGILNEYMDQKIQVSAVGADITPTQCKEIVKVHDLYQQALTADKSCVESLDYRKNAADIGNSADISNFERDANGNVVDWTKIRYGGDWIKIVEPTDVNKTHLLANPNNHVPVKYADAVVTETGNIDSGCLRFVNINKAKRAGNTSIYCDKGSDCINGQELENEVMRLGQVMDQLEILGGEKSNMAKSMLIGAGVGATAGGLATAITAFVEKNNISCRVGDGLEKISMGKSHTIGSLKDFYVKWNLRLPDTIMPTAQVIDCDSWKYACATLTDLNQCAAAQINYRPATANSTTYIPGACTASGSVCIENHAVAVSHGACPQ